MAKTKKAARARRSFTPEFKAGAVRLVQSGKSASQVAKELDAAAADLAARGPALDSAEASTAAKRAELEVREQDAVALVEAAYPGTDLE